MGCTGGPVPVGASGPSKRDPAAAFTRRSHPAARRVRPVGLVGLVGYEINFNRYFNRYTPPRPLEEIDAELRAIEADIVRMLAEVTGGGSTRPEG